MGAFPTTRELTFVTICFTDGHSRDHFILDRDVERLTESYRKRYGKKIAMIVAAVPNFYIIMRRNGVSIDKGAPIGEIKAYAEHTIWKAPGVRKRDWRRLLRTKMIGSYP